jgi:hypothetical protein
VKSLPMNTARIARESVASPVAPVSSDAARLFTEALLAVSAASSAAMNDAYCLPCSSQLTSGNSSVNLGNTHCVNIPNFGGGAVIAACVSPGSDHCALDSLASLASGGPMPVRQIQ